MARPYWRATGEDWRRQARPWVLSWRELAGGAWVSRSVVIRMASEAAGLRISPADLVREHTAATVIEGIEWRPELPYTMAWPPRSL
jgi:hypothetical protein